MRLNQRQIEIFHAVMTEKSVTAAATSLRTSQPTISRELRDLEQYIGYDLFHRFGKRLTPTEQAQALYTIVQRSYVGLEEISRAATAIGGRSGAHLRIASLPAYADSILPLAIEAFLKAYPGALISIHSIEETALQNELTAAMFDLGLAERGQQFGDVAIEAIDAGEVVCILPAGHPLSQKPLLAPADFEDVEFVYFSQDDPYRRKLDDVFSNAGVNRRYIVETTTASSVCAMVAKGIGVSIVNPLTAAHNLNRGLVVRRFSVPIRYRIHLWRTTKAPRAVFATRFTKDLHAAIAEIKARLKPALAAGP
jgi:DNA-binding transcriptional LysR family regulator